MRDQPTLSEAEWGLVVELLSEEKLVMVTSTPGGAYDPETYIHVDWGADFTANAQGAFPALASPAIAMTFRRT